jgi:hypothetical protein
VQVQYIHTYSFLVWSKPSFFFFLSAFGLARSSSPHPFVSVVSREKKVVNLNVIVPWKIEIVIK